MRHVARFVLILLSTVLSASEEFFQDTSVLDQIKAVQGSTVPIDTNTKMGQFLRDYALVPSSSDQAAITPEIVERSKAIFDYFTHPFYFPGRQVLAQDTAAGKVTHRAVIKEVLPGDTYRIEVTEVLAYKQDMSPKETRVVERVVTHDELNQLNMPRRLAGNRANGISFDLVQDSVLKETVEKARAIIEKGMPDFRLPPAQIEAQQRKLYLKLMRLPGMSDMDHPGRPNDQADFNRRMQEMRSDPVYSRLSGSAGAHLKYRYGVCFEQAGTVWGVLQLAGIHRTGIYTHLVSGQTLDMNVGHGWFHVFMRRGKVMYLSDPTWEVETGWWKKKNYSGDLLMPLDKAYAKSGWSANRRTVRVEGEPVPPRPPSVLNVLRGGDGQTAAPRPKGRVSLLDRVRKSEPAQDWKGLFQEAVRARPGLDPKLDRVLKFVSEVPTASGRARAITQAIRTGKVQVYWVEDWKSLDPFRGQSGAVSAKRYVFLNPKHSFETLVMEVVHEGAHAEGYARTGMAAREAEAFLTELEFAEAAKKAKGVTLPRALGKLSHEKAKQMGPAKLEAQVRARWPHLYGLSEGPRPGHRMWMSVQSSAAKAGRGALGMGFFAGGFLLKEAVQGIAQKDYGRIKSAVKEMATPGFLGGFAVFAAAQHVTEKGVQVVGMKGALKSVTRFALPLYAAVGIMHAASGRSKPIDAAADATSFGATMLAMMPADMALRAALYPALIAAGPAGWAGIAAIEITKAALLLWGSEKIRPLVKEGLKWTGKKAIQAGRSISRNTKKAMATVQNGAANAAKKIAGAWNATRARMSALWPF